MERHNVKFGFFLQSIGFIILLLFFYACDGREMYSKFYEFKNASWSKNDTLYFEIDSSSIKIGQPMIVSLEVSNDSDYPYQNIWLYMQDDFGGKEDHIEKQYRLSDDLGRWKGSGFGSLYQLTLEYKKDIIFAEKRNYTLKIIQGMRDEPLHGIERVGVTIYSAQ